MRDQCASGLRSRETPVEYETYKQILVGAVIISVLFLRKECVNSSVSQFPSYSLTLLVGYLWRVSPYLSQGKRFASNYVPTWRDKAIPYVFWGLVFFLIVATLYVVFVTIAKYALPSCQYCLILSRVVSSWCF